MTQVIVLPHVELCPEGAVFEARAGESLCQNLLENGIAIEHACEMSCACTSMRTTSNVSGSAQNDPFVEADPTLP